MMDELAYGAQQIFDEKFKDKAKEKEMFDKEEKKIRKREVLIIISMILTVGMLIVGMMGINKGQYKDDFTFYETNSTVEVNTGSEGKLRLPFMSMGD